VIVYVQYTNLMRDEFQWTRFCGRKHLGIAQTSAEIACSEA